MRISKIYSNDSRMKPIIFNRGFNVIYGNVASKSGDKNEHNLGKTSLVHLINFLLLKGSNKKDFLSKYKEKFAGWIFYLEIELPQGGYLTIKRSVDKPTLISFKEHQIRNQEFSDSTVWDWKDCKLNAKKDKDAVTILEEYLNFNVLQDYSVRHFLSYALRTQKDYDDIFKMRQFAGLDVDWKPFLFNLLGYDDKPVIEKYRLQYEIKNYSNLLKTVLGNKKAKINDAYNLKAAIGEKERERKDIAEQINKFDFFLKEKNVNKELVNQVEGKISKLNSERYRLDHEIKQIQESLGTTVVFDLNDVKNIFEEAQIFLPEQLKKTYQDLLDFNTSLSTERSKYLRSDLQRNVDAIEVLTSELKRLNLEREEMLAFLRDTDTFSKYKTLQDGIFKLDEQINTYKAKLNSLGTAENYEKKIEELKVESKETAKKVKEAIDNDNFIFDSINTLFNEIFQKTLDYKALLVVKPNKEGNPEFAPITIDAKHEDQLTGQVEGYTATKVQCAAFVLAVLIVYSKDRFFKFAYHDGLLESWGDIPKVNFLKQIRNITKTYDIQYTISVIKTDIPQGFQFENHEIISTLTHEKPLFGFEF